MFTPVSLEQLIPCICWRYDRDEPQRLRAVVVNTVHTLCVGNHDISSHHELDLSRFVNLIVALTGQDGPCVLAGRMNMCSDSLTGLDMPRNNDSLGSFDDNRPNGLPTGGLHEIGALENSIHSHDASLRKMFWKTRQDLRHAHGPEAP